jgi:hypothetical protein
VHNELFLNRGFVALGILLFGLSHGIAEAGETAIASRTATVDGVKLHYLTAGHGPTVIPIHGYTQASRMWTPIIPILAEKLTVIARSAGHRRLGYSGVSGAFLVFSLIAAEADVSFENDVARLGLGTPTTL